ncbi:MAG: ABC transporter permease [Lachnospiraceae bacterium]|nr:ABC transporter permease [Lachnospiraceae bacterium]
MNKGLFSGWKDVFSFTFKQGMNAKNFKGATIGLALLLFIGGMAISVIMAFVQQKDATEVSPIEVVHVIDESGLDVLYLEGFLESNKEHYPSLSFIMEEGNVQEVSTAIQQEILSTGSEDSTTKGTQDVILHVGEEGEGYLMTLYLPEASIITEDEANDFLEDVIMVMEQSKLFSSGIPMEKLVFAMGSISSTMLDAGEEEKSLGEELVSMLLPMICIFFIYMMNLVYGQSMGNIVSMEKTSKLMEMMLTLTRPYGLIFGKIFAMTSIAVIQMFLWIGSFVVGFLLGDVVAKEIIYPEYNNLLLEVFKLMGGQEGSTAFTVGAFALALFTICLSFLFYCVLAGLVASFATKPENLAQVMSYYQLIMLAGFFGAYMLPLQEKEWINTILRIIPITSAYILPGDLVVGNVTVLQGILYMSILLVTTIVLVIVTGKIYKNQLFYKGTSLKDRFKKKKK